MKNHIVFALGASVIAAAGYFVHQAPVLAWLGAHPYYDAGIAAIGVGFHAYNSYKTPA